MALVIKAVKEMAVDILSEPRYEHNCEYCTYLGRADKGDVYYCVDDVDNVSITTRYSNDAPNYTIVALH